MVAACFFFLFFFLFFFFFNGRLTAKVCYAYYSLFCLQLGELKKTNLLDEASLVLCLMERKKLWLFLGAYCIVHLVLSLRIFGGGGGGGGGKGGGGS